MINCPNCNHQNPDGALQCEACYTPLPSLANCPHCNATIQADASFCGQCGSDLREEALPPAGAGEASASSTQPDPSVPSSAVASTAAGSESAAPKTQNFIDPDESSQQPNTDIPDLVAPDPLIVPQSLGDDTAEVSQATEASQVGAEASAAGDEPEVDPGAFVSTPATPDIEPPENQPVAAGSDLDPAAASESMTSEPATPISPMAIPTPEPEPASEPMPTPTPAPARSASATQLQTFSARLRQGQTDAVIEIPRGLSVVRIGKPNDHTPPDIDVSGFPDSEVVSRTHANIRVEGDTYYLEDVGSSNGTYINGLPLPVGNRHRLRPGDRIALGKGDKVSFIFEMTN